MKKIFLLLLSMLALSPIAEIDACTRIVYAGDNITLTGRTMDWNGSLNSNIWGFPRGMERIGDTGTNPLKWTSKYGSVVTSALELASTDGINEKGLVANLLWLPESKYEDRNEKKPGLTITAWIQYLLDNFATVDEAVKAMESREFQITTIKLPDEAGEGLGLLHISISDESGDNAIFQFIDGKLDIYHSRDYKVVTNSPTYDKQLAIVNYWENIGGLKFLPGTDESPDRFARASFYLNALPQTTSNDIAVASVFSIIRNVSVPYGIFSANGSNISTTQWSTLSDSKNKRYYFETILSPNTFWVDLDKLNLEKGAPVLKLSVANGEIYNGETSKDFKQAQPFSFFLVE